MTKATLTTWQRITLLGLIGQIEGNVATIRRANKWMTVLELSPEDTKEIGMAQNAETGAISWKDQRDWEIELPEDPKALELVRAKFSEAKWAAREYKSVQGISDILGITLVEE